MTEVVLAEYDGQVWLVAGDEYIGELLTNELPEGVTVEFVTCDSQMAVFAMWEERSPAARPGAHPWIINPVMMNKIRGAYGPPRRSVAFTPWSVLLGTAEQADLAAAAAWLAQNPGGYLVLRQFAPNDPAPGQADVQRLRGQLVRGALERAGADGGRMTDDMGVAATPADAERLDIITELPPASLH